MTATAQTIAPSPGRQSLHGLFASRDLNFSQDGWTATTAADGAYSLRAPDGSVLVFDGSGRLLHDTFAEADLPAALTFVREAICASY